MLATYHGGGGCLLPLLLLLDCVSFSSSPFPSSVLSFFRIFPLPLVYICRWYAFRFLPLRRVTATEFLIDALPALVFVYLLVRGQSWPRLNPMSFGFPCCKFPVRVDALAVWRPLSTMLS